MYGHPESVSPPVLRMMWLLAVVAARFFGQVSLAVQPGLIPVVASMPGDLAPCAREDTLSWRPRVRAAVTTFHL